jgi:hypothetical protein
MICPVPDGPELQQSCQGKFRSQSGAAQLGRVGPSPRAKESCATFLAQEFQKPFSGKSLPGRAGPLSGGWAAQKLSVIFLPQRGELLDLGLRDPLSGAPDSPFQGH